jgi:ABC-type multidrug transport system permease subunit
MSVGQSSFAETISEEQSLGTLEQLFVSKTPLWQILVFSSIWNYLKTSIIIAPLMNLSKSICIIP